MNTKQGEPYYNASAATKLALGAGIVAGLVVYLVNGQDLARAAIAAAIWVVIGWYSGKAMFPRKTTPTPKSDD